MEIKQKPHVMWPHDIALFNSMVTEFSSENEKEFFAKMKQKQEYEYTCAGDLVLSEESNDLHIYIVRIDYDEYLLGKVEDGKKSNETHFQSLYNLLNADLKSLSLHDDEITLQTWLREIDYQGIEYEHNYDYM